MKLAGHPRHCYDWFALVFLSTATHETLSFRKRRNCHMDSCRQMSGTIVNLRLIWKQCLVLTETLHTFVSHCCWYWLKIQKESILLVHFVFIFSFPVFLPDFVSLHVFSCYYTALLIESILIMYIRHHFFFFFLSTEFGDSLSQRLGQWPLSDDWRRSAEVEVTSEFRKGPPSIHAEKSCS